MNKIWWLWVPVLFMVLQIWLENTLSAQTLSILHSENGFHELLQFSIVFAAFIVAAITLFKMDISTKKGLAGWISLAALCCFYVAGEEVSWGQHFIGWGTPETWIEVNDQQETNLHNTSSWLDQKPRLLLEIGIITGGLLIPLLRRYRPELLPKRFAVIYPLSQLAVIALLGIGVKFIAKITGHFDIILFERASEIEELYLYYFILLYLLTIKQRAICRHFH